MRPSRARAASQVNGERDVSDDVGSSSGGGATAMVTSLVVVSAAAGNFRTNGHLVALTGVKNFGGKLNKKMPKLKSKRRNHEIAGLRAGTLQLGGYFL